MGIRTKKNLVYCDNCELKVDKGEEFFEVRLKTIDQDGNIPQETARNIYCSSCFHSPTDLDILEMDVMS